ncbi:MAG: hypothetical protein LUC93_02315 [Planctomycetaceae bacterium]|nr:hypothetical protein [Planctomycetaceae bacterium]
MHVEPSIAFVCASSSAFVAHHLPLAAKAAGCGRVHAVLTIDDERHLEIIRSKNIAVHAIPLSRKSRNPLRVIDEVRTMRRILRDIEPDVIECAPYPRFILAGYPDPGSPSSIPAETLQDWVNYRFATWSARGGDIPSLCSNR